MADNFVIKDTCEAKHHGLNIELIGINKTIDCIKIAIDALNKRFFGILLTLILLLGTAVANLVIK